MWILINQPCPIFRFQILADEKAVSDLLPKMVSAIRFIRRDPEDPLAQLELICACEHAVQVRFDSPLYV